MLISSYILMDFFLNVYFHFAEHHLENSGLKLDLVKEFPFYFRHFPLRRVIKGTAQVFASASLRLGNTGLWLAKVRGTEVGVMYCPLRKHLASCRVTYCIT
jgi:hypothetical protein